MELKIVVISGVSYSIPIDVIDWCSEQKDESLTLSEIVYNLKKAPKEVQNWAKITMNFEIIKKLLKDDATAPAIKKYDATITKKNILIKEERILKDPNAANDLLNEDGTTKISGDKFFNTVNRQFMTLNKTLIEMNTILSIRGLEGYFFVRPDENSTLCCLLNISGDVKVLSFLAPKELKKFFDLPNKEQMEAYAMDHKDF
ncbi:hypothetical protein [Enterococcus sp. AZ126]|uniref:hypothetical protein n=1 Tax=Enterococcus sp. AZ126 TaxID=2774635 RepID=UPI003F227C00